MGLYERSTASPFTDSDHKAKQYQANPPKIRPIKHHKTIAATTMTNMDFNQNMVVTPGLAAGGTERTRLSTRRRRARENERIANQHAQAAVQAHLRDPLPLGSVQRAARYQDLINEGVLDAPTPVPRKWQPAKAQLDEAARLVPRFLFKAVRRDAGPGLTPPAFEDAATAPPQDRDGLWALPNPGRAVGLHVRNGDAATPGAASPFSSWTASLAAALATATPCGAVALLDTHRLAFHNNVYHLPVLGDAGVGAARRHDAFAVYQHLVYGPLAAGPAYRLVPVAAMVDAAGWDHLDGDLAPTPDAPAPKLGAAAAAAVALGRRFAAASTPETLDHDVVFGVAVAALGVRYQWCCDLGPADNDGDDAEGRARWPTWFAGALHRALAPVLPDGIDLAGFPGPCRVAHIAALADVQVAAHVVAELTTRLNAGTTPCTDRVVDDYELI